jgi:phage shock protein C
VVVLVKGKIKKLYRSSKDSVLAGVLGGIAEYFETDPTLVRLAFILIALVTGIFPAIVFYIIAAILMPKEVF